MAIGIELPQYLWDRQTEIQYRTWEMKFTEDETIIFNTEFLQLIAVQVDELEQFIRNECLATGNYILDPNIENKTSLRFTGEIIQFMFHDINILIHARVNNPFNIRRIFQFWIDAEDYLKEQSDVDGVCLSLLPFVMRSHYNNEDHATAWERIKDLVDFMKSKNKEMLGWVCGPWSVIRGGQVYTRTPQIVKEVSVFTIDAYTDLATVYFDELYVDGNETKVFDILKKWADVVLTGIAKYGPDFRHASYMQEFVPISISLFERPVAFVWEAAEISELDKIDLVTRILAAYDKVTHLAAGGWQRDNLEILEQKRGLDVIVNIEKWLPSRFINELTKKDSVERINTLFADLEEMGALDTFKTAVIKEINATESLATRIGEKLQIFVNNVLTLDDEEIKASIAEAFAHCSLTRIANEIMVTIVDSDLKKSYAAGSSSISYVLTNKIPMEGGNIKIVHNLKNGMTKIYIDTLSGVTETKFTAINNYFSETPVSVTGPIVVRVDYDTMFIVPE